MHMILNEFDTIIYLHISVCMCVCVCVCVCYQIRLTVHMFLFYIKLFSNLTYQISTYLLILMFRRYNALQIFKAFLVELTQ